MSVVMQQDYVSKTSGIINIVPTADLITTWPIVVPMYEKAEEYWRGYYTLEDMYIGILAGNLQLWVARKNGKIFATGLTSIEKYPQSLVLRCLFLAGSGAKTILPCIKEIEQWAAMLGATKSEIIGRDAWERLAKPYGYVKRSVVMTKELVNLPNVPQTRRH